MPRRGRLSSWFVRLCVKSGRFVTSGQVSELDLECDGTTANTGALAVPPELVDDLLESVTRGFVGEEIGGKRVLSPDGFPYPIGADGPLVDAPCSPVIVGARFSEMLLQEG